MRKLGVILLSGGLDSTTVAAIAQKQGYELMAITLNYGQKHVREIESAKKIARAMNIKHEVVDISFFKKLAWYSALTSSNEFSIPESSLPQERIEEIPITYVPLRNTFFITLAAAFLESEVLNLIERKKISPGNLHASIFIAANAIDYSGYPDCRPEFYSQMSQTLYLGSKLGTQYHLPIAIETPIISLTKAEIVRMSFELKAPLELTWSCYTAGEKPCGKCDSCLIRAKGFSEARFQDPALETKN